MEKITESFKPRNGTAVSEIDRFRPRVWSFHACEWRCFGIYRGGVVGVTGVAGYADVGIVGS